MSSPVETDVDLLRDDDDDDDEDERNELRVLSARWFEIDSKHCDDSDAKRTQTALDLLLHILTLQMRYKSLSSSLMSSYLRVELDECLTRIHQSRVSINIINALLQIAKTSDEPKLRFDSHTFFYDIILQRTQFYHHSSLKAQQSTSFHQCNDTNIIDVTHVFSSISALVLCGLTDIWSAIRKICAHKIALLFPLLHLKQVLALFEELTAQCHTKSHNWQRIHGAITGIHAILHGFRWRLLPSTANTGHNSIGMYMTLGNIELAQLPEVWLSRLPSLLYKLLAHTQISIREMAVKTFGALLNRSDILQTQLALSTIIHLLEEQSNIITSFEAEGLLSLCTLVVRRLPSSTILTSWTSLLNVVQPFLEHTASTVRQSAGNVLSSLCSHTHTHTNTLNTQDSHETFERALLVNLVVESISCNWKSDYSDIEHDNFIGGMNASPFTSLPPTSPQQLHTHNEFSTYSWQWKEGRLLALELVLRELLKHCSSTEFSPSTQRCPSITRTHSPPIKLSQKRSIIKRRHPAHTSCEIKSSFPMFALVRPMEKLCQKHNEKYESRTSISGERVRSQSVPVFDGGARKDFFLQTLVSMHSNKKYDKPFVNNETMTSCCVITSIEYALKITCSKCRVAELNSWLHALHIQPIGLRLRHMLDASVSCIVERQWELRRIGEQILPLLVKMLTIIELSQLHNIWCSQYQHETFFSAILSLLSLKYVLQQLLDQCRTMRCNSSIQSVDRIILSSFSHVLRHARKGSPSSRQVVYLALEILILSIAHRGTLGISTDNDSIELVTFLLVSMRCEKESMVNSSYETWLFSSASRYFKPFIIGCTIEQQAKVLTPLIQAMILSNDHDIHTRALNIVDVIVRENNEINDKFLDDFNHLLCCVCAQIEKCGENLHEQIEMILMLCLHSRMDDMRISVVLQSVVKRLKAENNGRCVMTDLNENEDNPSEKEIDGVDGRGCCSHEAIEEAAVQSLVSSFAESDFEDEDMPSPSSFTHENRDVSVVVSESSEDIEGTDDDWDNWDDDDDDDDDEDRDKHSKLKLRFPHFNELTDECKHILPKLAELIFKLSLHTSFSVHLDEVSSNDVQNSIRYLLKAQR